MEQVTNNRKKLIEGEIQLLEDHRKANKEILIRHFYDLHPLDNAHAERTTKKRHPEVPNVSFFYFVVSARSLPLQVKASDKNICCESRLISSSPGSDDLSEPGCAASRPGESATRAHTRGSHQP